MAWNLNLDGSEVTMSRARFSMLGAAMIWYCSTPHEHSRETLGEGLLPWWLGACPGSTCPSRCHCSPSEEMTAWHYEDGSATRPRPAYRRLEAPGIGRGRWSSGEAGRRLYRQARLQLVDHPALCNPETTSPISHPNPSLMLMSLLAMQLFFN